MADVRQRRPDDLTIAQSGRRRQRPAPGRPTAQTVHNGDMVWFRYTNHQWMRGRIVGFGRSGMQVQVMGGEISRTVHVKWEDAQWHQTRDAD